MQKNHANASYGECKHYVYCDSCTIMLYTNNQLNNTCPTCTKLSYSIYTTCVGGCNCKVKLFSMNKRSTVHYYPYSICYECDPEYQNTITSHLAKPVPNKHIKILMILLNKAVTEDQWINRFKECIKMIENDAKKNNTHYLFTVEQIIPIGQFMIKFSISNPHSNMRNALTALCICPWKLPHDPFSFGVCYFGNMGTTPDSASDALNLINNNIQKWKQMRFDIQP